MPKKPFKDNEVDKLLEYHSEVLKQLEIVASYNLNKREETKKESELIATKKVLSILQGVPVEELSKKKKGLRVKALRDAGYDSMDKIYSARPYQLSQIYGISEDAAYQIKRITSEYATETAKTIKIKISTDDKNENSSRLVSSLYKYINSEEYSELGSSLLSGKGKTVKNAIYNINNAKGFFKWLFLSSEKKELAIDSYDFLQRSLKDDYLKRIKNLSGAIDSIERSDIETCWKDFAVNSVEYFSALERINPGLLGNSDSLYGLPEDLATQIQDECYFPDGLLCTLRKYQEWGVKYILHQGKVLLGDEMGLGKTIQAIATMVSLKNTGATHFLVVCPLSVLTNWYREIKKHSLLPVVRIHGSDKKTMISHWLKKGGVAVTTYETTSAFNLSEDFRLSLLVVDEAHYIKNKEAQRTKNVANVASHAERVLYMTGTALENRVEEMLKLIGDLQPEVAAKAAPISFMASAEQFRNTIAPVYYRRKREDVLTELPELIENEEWCTMLPDEEKAYEESMLARKYSDARRVSWIMDDLSKSSKAIRMKEIVEEATSDERKIIVFSFYLDTIRKVKELFGNKCLEPINGSIPPKRRQEIIDDFDKAVPGTVLVSQIISGGTGLNIQSGSVVIICEPQLKPSIENQAISRAYRMGQTRNVLVYRLLCENSIDEKITEALMKKQMLFDAFADKSVAAQQKVEIDETSMGDLIKEEIERINKKRGIVPKKAVTNKNLSYYGSLIDYSYKDLVNGFLYKYGPVEGDYYLTPECKSKNLKIRRTSEGLMCHHIDEDKAIMLSTDSFAVRYPFEYQKADRLVYCNYLEHLLLHIKIAEESDTDNSEVLAGIGGAVNFIVRILNGFYSDKIVTQEYLCRAQDAVIDDYDSYILYLNKLWKVIKNDRVYSSMYTKKKLAQDWDGNINNLVLNDIKD